MFTQSGGRRNGRRGAGRGRRSQTSIVEIFTRPEQHPLMRVLGWVVRYRAELTATTIIVVVALYLRHAVGPDWATGILVVLTVSVFAVPVSRRYVTARMWCVYARHRARCCFVQTRTMTHDGRMPFLYWSRPSPVGERIRVWLPAGLEVKDLEQICPELAVACWARSARVETNRAYAHLMVIEIVRRDPLGTADVITPTILHGLDDDIAVESRNAAVVVALPDRASLPVPTPRQEPPIPAKAGRRAPGTPQPRAANANANANTNAADADAADADGTVTGFGGVDVSDYV